MLPALSTRDASRGTRSPSTRSVLIDSTAASRAPCRAAAPASTSASGPGSAVSLAQPAASRATAQYLNVTLTSAILADVPSAPLVPVAEHRAGLLSRVARLGSEQVPLTAALGRVLAAPVHARHPLPPFESSAMDGYAVRAGDTAAASPTAPVDLLVAAVAPAGAPTAHRLRPGEAVQIFTGGVVPEGADGVVPVEEVEVAGERVRLRAPVRPGAYVRRAGEELAAGAVVAAAGRRIGPGVVAAIAAAGHPAVEVVRRPRVAVVSTGDELRDPGDPLGPGELPDSNAVSVAAAARTAGAEVVLTTRSPDEPTAFLAAIRAAAASADVVITTGGVSAGAERDVVKSALAPLGDVEFVRVAMQPGMPQAVGTVDGTLLLGLPGNPVSALVSMAVFAAPVLRARAGLPEPPPYPPVVLGGPVTPLRDKTRYVRVRLERTAGPHAVAFPVGGHGSHLVAALAGTDALIEVPPGTAELAAGDPVAAVAWFSSEEVPT